MTLDERYIKRLPADKKKIEDAFLDRMRRKRHATIYDTAGTISEKEAGNAVERAEKLVHEIERMLRGDKK